MTGVLYENDGANSAQSTEDIRNVPVVAEENRDDEKSGRHAECGEDERHNGPRAVPRQMFRWDLVATGELGVGRKAGLARDAGVVERVAIFPAGYAAPAALVLKKKTPIDPFHSKF